MSRWTAVRGYQCDHGHTIPMSGVTRGGRPWLGLFCPAGKCRPSWREPSDPWLVSGVTVGDDETRDRMAQVRQAGVLADGKGGQPA